jgi:hypothetical protein
MWLVKNSKNVIDYRIVSDYYYLIECECGFQMATIKRNGVMKRVLRVVKGHACEMRGQG